MQGNSPKLEVQNQPTFEDYYDQERIAVFEMFLSAYNDAVQNVGSVEEFHVQIAEKTINFQFAGNSLISKVTRALKHLEIDKIDDPDLVIKLWDSESTQRPLPLLINTVKDCIPYAAWLKKIGRREEVYPFSNDRFLSSLQWGSEILTLLDKERNQCIYWVENVDKIPWFEVGAPIRTVFHWYFSSTKSQMVHGGAVGNEKGGVLLAGEGGSGKSTTALNCLKDGMLYASDDYVLVDTKNQPKTYSLFQTAKVKTKDDIERFPEFESWVTNPRGVEESDEKPMLFVGENKPKQMAKEIPINALVFPKFIAGEKCHYERISEQKAFRGIAPSTINQAPFAGEECVKMLANLVRELPAYYLKFGEDQESLSQTIKQIIKENQQDVRR